VIFADRSPVLTWRACLRAFMSDRIWRLPATLPTVYRAFGKLQQVFKEPFWAAAWARARWDTLLPYLTMLSLHDGCRGAKVRRTHRYV